LKQFQFIYHIIIIQNYENFNEINNSFEIIFVNDIKNNLVEIIKFLNEISLNNLITQLKNAIFIEPKQYLKSIEFSSILIGIQDIKQSAISSLISFHLFSRILKIWNYQF